jgi:flagellar biosynthesis protein FlhG
MGISEYQQSAKYRERLTNDLHNLFPHLEVADDNALARLDRQELETAYEDRRADLHQRHGGNPRVLDANLARLSAAFEHLIAFLDDRQAHHRRHGENPLRVDPDEPVDQYKSIFLANRGYAEIIAIGGGKGGIGKSMVTANLAIALATLGRQVVAVDMDLGGADLHLSLGLRHLPRSLNDFIDRKYDSLDEVRLTTAYKNLTVIATDSSRLGAANIKYAHKEKILRHLSRLNCDVVLIDLGAEVSFNVLDVFLAADHRYVLTSAEPTSVLEAYGLIKLSLYRKMRHFASETVSKGSDLGKVVDDFLYEKGDRSNGHPKTVWELIEHVRDRDPALHKQLLRLLYGYSVDLIINMSEGEGDKRIAATMARLCQENLGINLRRSYRVPMDKNVRTASRKLIPVVVGAPNCPASRAVFDIAAETKAGRVTAAEMSKQVGDMAEHIIERIQKMREMSALAAPGLPVNTLIPVDLQPESVGSKIRKFLNTEIHLNR